MTAPKAKTWEHAAEWVTLLGAAAFAAAAVLPPAGVPGWTLWTIELLAGLTAVLTVWGATGSARFAWAVGSVGIYLAAWTAWVEHARLWGALPVTMLLSGSTVLIPACALSAAARHKSAPAAPGELTAGQDPAARAEAEKKSALQKYEYMLEKVDCPGVAATDLSEDRSGRVVTLELPNTGKITLAALEAVSGRIEVILRAGHGAVRFEPGKHSGEVVMRIREREVLANMVELRPEYLATTINQKFAVGVQEDGNLLKITLRGLHMMIVGATGAGKSNLLNVLVAQLASCVDTVIWVIDLKGGRMAKSWVQAWAEGNADAPAIDWVATTREEAALMVQAFNLAIETRMNSGVGGSKITPSASRPQIILVCDEMADILGDDGPKRDVTEYTNLWFTGQVSRIGQKGRSEAASGVWASQRGTSDMGGAAKLKANWMLRAALGTATEGELQWVLPDARASRKQLKLMSGIPGVAMFGVQANISQLTKVFFLDHPDDPASETGESLCDNGCVAACPVYRMSVYVGTGDRRPRLDAMTALPLGDAYADRWERSAHLTGGRVMTIARPSAGVDTAEFDSIVRDIDPDREVHPGRRLMRRFLEARGAMGAKPSAVIQYLSENGIEVTRETVQRWLAADAERGLVHNPDFGRWKTGPGPKKDESAA